MHKYRYLIFFLARLVLGGSFIYASIDKIIHPDLFAEVIYNYKILPTNLINIAAIILPSIEIIIGVLLILGIQVFSSASIVTALLLIFMTAIGYNLSRGLDFQCGCFTTAPEAKFAGFWTLLRDVLLLIPAAICLWFSALLKKNRRTAF